MFELFKFLRRGESFRRVGYTRITGSRNHENGISTGSTNLFKYPVIVIRLFLAGGLRRIHDIAADLAHVGHPGFLVEDLIVRVADRESRSCEYEVLQHAHAA